MENRMGKSLGEYLALCREIKGMTLRDVEKHTGISNASLSQFEIGKHEPSFSRVVKLADLYGVRLERLAKEARKA
jgi:HTH-type transcriptional regulator, competence development regulator